MSKNHFEDLLNSSPELKKILEEKVKSMKSYVPKIGIMGKSGAGKSSLINAILGKKVCETGGVGGCTRAFQEEKFTFNGCSITFMDLPGIAENKARHEEYLKLYAEKLKTLDLVLWVIKVDDRANQNDEDFYTDILKAYCDTSRVLFVLSQCDKAEPIREFARQHFKPSEKQLNIIEQNRQRVINSFSVDSKNVLAVACDYYDEKFDLWNIQELVTRIIMSVPDQAKPILGQVIDPKNIQSSAKNEINNAVIKFIQEELNHFIDSVPAPKFVKDTAKDVVNYVSEKFDDFIDWLF